MQLPDLNLVRAWARILIPLAIIGIRLALSVAGHPAADQFNDELITAVLAYLAVDGGAKVVQTKVQ